MIPLNPLPLFFPKTPTLQILQNYKDLSLAQQIDYRKHPHHFIHVIEGDPPLKIWQQFLTQKAYRQTVSNYYVVNLRSAQENIWGILGGISMDAATTKTLYKHEEIVSSRVARMRDYLGKIQLQAEPTVVGASFSDELHELIKNHSDQTILHSFKWEHHHYRLWEAQEPLVHYLRNSAFCEAFLIDGHHRTACLESLQKQQPKNSYQLLSFVIDLKSVQTASFLWIIRKPQSSMIHTIRQWPSERLAEKLNSFTQPQLYCGNQCYFPPGNSKAAQLESVYSLFQKHSSQVEYLPNSLLTPETMAEFIQFGGILFGYPKWGIEELCQWSRTGGLLPPKSTYNQPKLCTGLAISPLESPIN